MLKPCNHVAGKSLLPPAALQKSDSVLADVAGESCPSSRDFGAFTAFCYSLRWILPFCIGSCKKLDGRTLVWAVLVEMQSSGLFQADSWCSNLTDKIYCWWGIRRRCRTHSCSGRTVCTPEVQLELLGLCSVSLSRQFVWLWLGESDG